MSEKYRPIPARLHLVRDVLDNGLKDRAGEHMGRADRIVLSIRPGEPPRVVRIEAGMSALAARLNGRLGRVVRAMGRGCGLHGGKPTRFAWSKVQAMGLDLKLDTDKHQSPASLWERWLRKHVIRRLPGVKNT